MPLDNPIFFNIYSYIYIYIAFGSSNSLAISAIRLLANATAAATAASKTEYTTHTSQLARRCKGKHLLQREAKLCINFRDIISKAGVMFIVIIFFEN